MKKHSSQKLISIHKEIQAGATITETCRKHNISKSTYYDWLNNSIKNSELKNLKAENDKLIRLIVDQALYIQAFKTLLKKDLFPAIKKKEPLDFNSHGLLNQE